MKTLVVYYTKSGHSKDYAETISSRVDATLIHVKELKKDIIKEHDTIVFVSSVYANKINKIEKFLYYALLQPLLPENKPFFSLFPSVYQAE